MIKKAFDYYYLVLMRGYGSWFVSYNVSSAISMLLTLNIASLVILFDYHILDSIYFWICCFVIGAVFFIIIDAIYNKKRREEIKEKYKDGSPESRLRGAVWVWVYAILSIAFLVLALSTIKGPTP